MPFCATRFAFRSSTLLPSPRFSVLRLDCPIPRNFARYEGICLYLFSGSEDPVGTQLAGVQILIDRYSKAGIINLSHNFYPGGRHEMLNELNREEVCRNLLTWISALSESPISAM